MADFSHEAVQSLFALADRGDVGQNHDEADRSIAGVVVTADPDLEQVLRALLGTDFDLGGHRSRAFGREAPNVTKRRGEFGRQDLLVGAPDQILGWPDDGKVFHEVIQILWGLMQD
ncbi:MAG TPA: hypothetical protein VGM83_20965 [Devosiaceae bacterium]|jgi:hypothetical protein